MTTTTHDSPDPGVPGPQDQATSSPWNGKGRSRLVVPRMATMLLVVCVVLLLYLRSRPDHPLTEGSRAASGALEIDLGGGSAGGRNYTPVLSPRAGLQEVTLAFKVPVNPGAVYEVEVQGPGEDPLIRYDRGPLLLDDLGGASISIPTSRLEKSGGYILVVREFPPDGAVREYRYSFRVALRASG